MSQRPLIPVISGFVAAAGLTVLIGHGLGMRGQKFEGIWQSLMAPRSAHAADSSAATVPPGPPPTIHNPFVDGDASPAKPTANRYATATTAPQTESRPRDRYRDNPSLEPIRPRRMNPQLTADTDHGSDAEMPPAQPTVKTPLVQQAVPAKPKANRYADTTLTQPARYQTVKTVNELAAPTEPVTELVPEQLAAEKPAVSSGEIMTVSHNDPLPEVAPQPQLAPEREMSEPAIDSPEPTLAAPPEAPTTVESTDTPEPNDVVAEPRPLSLPEELPVSDIGDQRGGVTLQWITPSSVSVDQEATCQLLVRNVSDATARFVAVDVQLPAGVEFGSAEPKAQTEGQRLTWELGDMAPGSSQTAQVTFTPRQQGDVTPRAAVTFTRHVAATIQIVEPRLALVVEGPRESIVGQPTPYQFRVTNKGTGPAMGVSVEVAPSDGLEAANGSQSRYTIGTLSPGESRHVQVMMSGSQPGDCSLHGRAFIDQRPMDKSSCSIRIVQPALSVAMDGPKLRFVDRRAAYTITVQNPGPAPIDNVQLLEQVPEGFRFVEASSGGNYDRNVRQVAWFVGRLEANETATVGVQLMAVEAGDHRLNAAAKADCGVVGEAETTTRVKGAPHVTIDVTEDDDPVEIDGETMYRIRLSNMGSTPARRVQFAAEVPREMQILEANGPAAGMIKGQQLVFPPIDVLEPGQTTAYEVHVKCKKAGQVRFKAYFRSEDAPDPVLEEEATRIYAD
ncbi:MAG TPA: hypothetical protein VGN12_07460 [Pirellulales bacterium]